MSDTVAQMRLLAAAVPSVEGGVPYQPIFPATLLSWAEELEELESELSECKEKEVWRGIHDG
jgi:hypothetical protein